MHLFFRRYLRDIITALFLIVVGILLLINPVAFAMGLVKLAGVFLVVLGALRIVRYFRTDPETAARGQDFFIGLIAILGGLFCVILGAGDHAMLAVQDSLPDLIWTTLTLLLPFVCMALVFRRPGLWKAMLVTFGSDTISTTRTRLWRCWWAFL